MEIGVKLWCDDIYIPKLKIILSEIEILKINDYWLVMTDKPQETKKKIDKYFEGIE